MAERCDHCRFWKVAPAFAADVDHESGDTGFGWCRRNPPRIIEHMARLAISGPTFGHQTDATEHATVTTVEDASLFPATFGTSWCGRFEEIHHG